jgi:hypothetical protein
MREILPQERERDIESCHAAMNGRSFQDYLQLATTGDGPDLSEQYMSIG